MRILILLLAILLPAGRVALAAEQTPGAAVEALHDALAESMRNGAHSECAARRTKLAPIVTERFDIPGIADLILRRHWADFDAGQRSRFLAALQTNIVANYATNFDSDHGERFETLSSQAQSRFTRVSTQLTRPDASPVHFDYLLRTDSDGHWRIINVFADGVSDIALRRTQYEQLIDQKGIDGLLQFLDDQNRQLLQRCG